MSEGRNQVGENERNFRELAAALEKELARKTAELETKNRELVRCEERYHKMVEEVEDYAIILLDKEGIIQNWNKGAEKIKGYSEPEIVGKSFKVFYLPADRESGLPDKLFHEAVTKGKALHEGWRLRKDKTTFWGSIVLTSLHDEQGEVIGFTKVTRDLTERKQSEDKLNQYLRELEFQNKELEQFAYAASHDMKEPLRKIIFYNTFINDTSASMLPEKAQTYLQRSIGAAQRLHRLIDDLLSYSRASFQNNIDEIVDLNEVLLDVINSHNDVLDDKNGMVMMESLPVVHGISFQLRQLFDNLISNAIKYSHPERPLKIHLTSQLTKGADLTGGQVNPEKNYYGISVADNGVGFDQDQEDKIFELFQRLNTNITTVGTGLGLAISRRVVQNHKGLIKAEGRINEGATFTVFLPQATEGPIT